MDYPHCELCCRKDLLTSFEVMSEESLARLRDMSAAHLPNWFAKKRVSIAFSMRLSNLYKTSVDPAWKTTFSRLIDACGIIKEARFAEKGIVMEVRLPGLSGCHVQI